MICMVPLHRILAICRPESWGGTRGETWPEHARYLWETEPVYMRSMLVYMRRIGRWFHKPVRVDDRVVQDSHHRLVTAEALGWHDLLIPVIGWPEEGCV
jgi:hypothetical protein